MRNIFKGFLCGHPQKRDDSRGLREARWGSSMQAPGERWVTWGFYGQQCTLGGKHNNTTSSTISWWPWDPDDKQCTLGRQHTNTSLLTVNGEWMRGRAVNAFWKEWMNATVFQCIGTLHIYTLELILAGCKNIYFVSSWISFLKSGKIGYFIRCKIGSHELKLAFHLFLLWKSVTVDDCEHYNSGSGCDDSHPMSIVYDGLWCSFDF